MTTDLKKQFDRLPTFEKKYLFWEKTLKQNYLDFLVNFNDRADLHKYEIEVEKEEWKFYNEFLLDKFKKSTYLGTRLLSFEKMKTKFNQELKTKSNKPQFISLCLKDIADSFFDFGGTLGKYRGRVLVNIKYQANWDSYKNMYEYNLEPDWSQYRPGLNILNIENGKTLAKYHLYLEKIRDSKSKGVNENDEQELTIKQFALVLHYSGVLKALNYDVTLKANLFAPLFKRNKKEIYDAFREVHLKQNKKDLQRVLDFFKENNIKKVIPAVEKDLNK